MGFEFASRATQGARAYQEDAVAVQAGPDGPDRAEGADARSPALCAVLADGMGGHAGGALASSTACRVFLAAFESSSGKMPARLYEALQIANLAIAECVENKPRLAGMGCTLVGTSFGPEGLEWVSVGDSPLFLVRGSEIEPLNEDHSMAPEIDKLAEAGRISWEEARNDSRRHFLRSAVTGTAIEMVDRSRRPLALETGDIVVLASDGIHTLTQPAIHAVVTRHAAEPAGVIADALIRAVLDEADDHQDNTSVIVVRVLAD